MERCRIEIQRCKREVAEGILPAFLGLDDWFFELLILEGTVKL